MNDPTFLLNPALYKRFKISVFIDIMNTKRESLSPSPTGAIFLLKTKFTPNLIRNANAPFLSPLLKEIIIIN